MKGDDPKCARCYARMACVATDEHRAKRGADPVTPWRPHRMCDEIREKAREDQKHKVRRPPSPGLFERS
jgi:hypothetical protein